MKIPFLILIFSLCNSLALQAMDYSGGQSTSANSTYVGAYFSMPLGGGKLKAKQDRFKYGLTTEYRPQFGNNFKNNSMNFKNLHRVELINLSFSPSGFNNFNVVNLPLLSKDQFGRISYLGEGGSEGEGMHIAAKALLWGGAIIGGLAVAWMLNDCVRDASDELIDVCPAN